MSNSPELITLLAYGIPDACRALCIGRTRLYALIAEGKIGDYALCDTKGQNFQIG